MSIPQFAPPTESLAIPRAVPPVFQNHNEPVGGRLQYFWLQWQQLGASPWIVSILRRGFQIRFHEQPALSPAPKPFSLPGAHAKRLALSEEIDSMLTKNALEEVDVSSPGFYSILFLTPKSSGGWRPVIDLSTLNRFVKTPKFSMETAESIRLSLPRDCWAVSLDLKDAFFHIPIHPRSRKFLRFVYHGTIYQYRALPFGLSPAPWIFTMVVKEVQILAHRQGIFLHQYLDDWIIHHHCPKTLLAHLHWVLDLCKRLGLLVNLQKSELVPSQDFVFVGYRYKTKLGMVYPTNERILKLRPLLALFLDKPTQTAQLWQSLLGLLAATEKLVPFGRLHMRELQADLRSQWSAATGSPDQLVTLTAAGREAIIWWLSPDNLSRGSSFRPPPPSKHLFTDASTEGWGAHLDFMEVSGRWDARESSWHINRLELEAVQLALFHWEAECTGQSVLVSTDNSTVVAYINKQGGTRSLTLCRHVAQLLLWCRARSISLRARHIPGRLNVLADQLSRRGQIQPTEWSLSPRVFKVLCHRWDRPMVDLFATRWNTKLPLFVSPLPDPTATSIDALSTDWEGMYGYAYPPVVLLPKVLTKVRSHSCKIMLIAPCHPHRPWFPELLSLLIDHPVVLPSRWDLLKQPRSDQYHSLPGSLALHAWLLSNDPFEQRAFLEKCPVGSPGQIEAHLWESTSRSGGSSLIGAIAGRLIHSTPMHNL